MSVVNRLSFPTAQLLKTDGTPASGWKYKFYESGGSSTPQSAYSDSALSSAFTSLTLNSYGMPDVDIYLDPDLNYRLAITDGDDTEIFTFDNVRDFSRNADAHFMVYAGNPNGNVAGTAGTPGGSPSDAIFDTSNTLVWICTTTGTAGTAVWTNVTASLSGQLLITGLLSPASISTQQDDYNPTDLSTASYLRLNPGAAVDITGLAGGAAGRVVSLVNTSSSFNVTLRDQDSDSDAGNRFLLGNGHDVVLLPNYSVTLYYDGVTGRWRLWIPPFANLVLPRGYIGGCILSNGTDATNDIDVAAGECRDSTNTYNIKLSALTGKQLDADWAAGSSAGMRYSGAAIDNVTYHIWGATKNDGSDGDVYADPSATAATVLGHLQNETGGSDYVGVRRIGSILREGGAIVGFTQTGDNFDREQPSALDVDVAAPGTSANTAAVSVPTGIVVFAKMNVYSAADGVYISPLDLTDVATSRIAVPLLSVGASDKGAAQAVVRTDTSAQFRYRCHSNNEIRMTPTGWIDLRGKDD